MNNTLDYTPIGRDVIWKIKEKTDSGLVLPDSVTLAEEGAVRILAVGGDVKVVKPGDKVLLRGGARPTLLILNREKYAQASEGECLGVVGEDVDTTIPEDVFTPPPASSITK